MNSINVEIESAVGEFHLEVKFNISFFRTLALFGRSGSGKTTVLRSIAGLHRSRRARIGLGDQTWEDTEKGVFVPPHERRIGYVAQDNGLFPHLTVNGNLHYGYDRLPAAEPKPDWNEIVAVFGLSNFLERTVFQLSGGEKKRVALARAVLRRPRLLLLDEPLTGLDPESQQEVLAYLQKIKAEFAVPMIYVSHSWNEIATLADFTVPLDNGRSRAIQVIDRKLS